MLLVTGGTVIEYPPEIYRDEDRATAEAERWAWVLSGAGWLEIERPFPERWQVGEREVRLVSVEPHSEGAGPSWIGTFWDRNGSPDPEALLLSGRDEALAWVRQPPTGGSQAVETQPILMRLDSDLLDAFEASVDGRVSEGDFKWSADSTCCVVLASGGYPGAFEKGKVITGLDAAARLPDVKVFHAGTAKNAAGEFVTAGGRVLGVTARGATLEQAVERAYEACALIKFEGMHYRRDIAARALKVATKK